MFGGQQQGGWGQQPPQQQPQQQQQATNAFGQPTQQPNAFAASSFGQPAQSSFGQPQQQQTNAFGQPQQQTSAFGQPATSAFGQPAITSAFAQPQQNRNLFGQPAAGTTNTFGQPATSAFGQPASSSFGTASTSAFGAFGQPRTNAFGAPAATNAYGAPTVTAATPDVPPQGTLTPAYATTSERDTTGTTPVTHTYHAITCMPAYKGASFEELRLMDYTQNRKGVPAPGFGAAPGFGQPATTSAFGQPAASAFGQPSTSAFGAQATNTFGQPAASTSAFGQPATNAFGQPQQQQTSAFGQPAAGTSAFGQPAQNAFAQPASTSAFGTQPQTNTFSNFGAAKPFGSTFGQPAQPAPSSFGQPAPATSAFGQPAASTFGQPATSAFGQPQQQTSAFGQQPQQATSAFGLPASTFGQPATSAFGQPQQQQQQQQGAPGTGPSPFAFPGAAAQTGTSGGTFGSFGSTAAAPKPSLFGQPVAPTQPASSLFPSQGQQTQTTSAFGQPSQPASTGFNLFSQNQQGQQATPGLFGSQPQQQQTTGLFNNLPPTQQGGLGAFGQAAKPTFGTFGTQSIAQPNALQAPTGQGMSAPSGGLFGSLSQSVTTQPSRLISGSHFGDNTFFQDVMNAPKTTLALVSPERDNKKAPLLHSLRSSMASTRVASPMKLRPYGAGGGSPLTLSRTGTPDSLNSSTALSKSTFSSPHPILAGISDTTKILSPGAFVSRPSAKKLMIEGDALESPAPKKLPLPSLFLMPPSKLKPTISPAKSAEKSKSTTPAVDGDGEYWTKPSIDELTKLNFQDLTHVENFTVGRNGYGQVRFVNPVDLTAVGNLRDIPGKVVVFNNKECTVYPNEDEKPNEGEGLNVAAVISLHNCFPTNKGTSEPFTDMKARKMEMHIAKLRRMQDTTFVDFSDKGVWTFRVEHFSRYGLGDDEDEEEEEIAAPLPPAHGRGFAAPPEEEALLATESIVMQLIEEGEEEEDEPPQASLMDEDHSQLSFEDKLSMDTPRALSPIDEEEAMGSDNTVSPPLVERRAWPSKLNLEARKVHQMQASFFRAYDEPGPVRDFQHDRSLAFAQAVRDSQMKRDLRELGGEEDMDFDDDYTRAESVPLEPESESVPEPHPVPTFATTSRMKGHEGSFSDAALMLGRSFRVSWGPQGQLIHLGKLASAAETKSANDRINTLKITHVPVVADEESKEKQQSKRLLDLHIEHTEFVMFEDGPTAIAQPSLSFAWFSQLFPPEDHSHEALVWRLGEALWDHIPSSYVSHDVADAVQSTLQRHAVSEWLEGASLTNVESEMQDQITADKAIFTLMSGHLIERACNWAMDANDLRLATLLAQASGADSIFRGAMKEQLLNWKDEHVDAQVSSYYRKIYSLLTGEVLRVEGNRNITDRALSTSDVPIASSLDWKRAFGLFFWYGSKFETPFEEVFRNFEAEDGMPQPLPWYEEQEALARTLHRWSISSSAPVKDALFEMFRLRALQDPTSLSLLEDVLSPMGFTTSPLDYRLPWHMCMLLTQVKRVGTFEDVEDGRSEALDRLVLSYALQVERLGLWEYAALIYLHLSLPESREKAILDLLTRNAALITAEAEGFLVEKLQLPDAWIAEAKAVLAHYESRSYDEYELLLNTGKQIEAHEIAVRYLAPEAFLRKDWDLLRGIFNAFDPAHVPNWATHGGKAFLDYLDTFSLDTLIVARVTNVQMDAVERTRLERLCETVLRLLDLLPSVLSDHTNLAQNVCLNEMLVHLSQYLPILPTLGFKRPAAPSEWVEEASQLKMLQQDTVRSFDALLAAVSA